MTDAQLQQIINILWNAAIDTCAAWFDDRQSKHPDVKISLGDMADILREWKRKEED